MIPQPSRRRTGLLVLPGLALLTVACLFLGAGDGVAQEKPTLQGSESEFAGMVEIPAGDFEMGVDERWFKTAYLRERRLIPPQLRPPQKEQWWGILLRETPEHEVETEAYAIDRYEVTNAQYLAFLDDSCQQVVFTDRKMNNIYLVAVSIYGENPTRWEMESIYWLNLKKLQSMAAKVLAGNEALVKGALARFNQDMPEPAKKARFADLPEPNRIRAWLRFKLPEGTALNTYNRLVPEHWPQAKPASEELNHAVRYVSGLDADAFAQWAGKHIPTEAEWEKAARGPENTVYPWGDEWIADDKVQKNYLVWEKASIPPKAPAGDRPVAVDVCPLGQSGYGCFNMLGNVMEWTSSPPLKYPRSDAEFSYWGAKGARVLRGQNYGSGVSFKSKEISIRATTRIIEGPDGPIDERNLYSALGFRCAKYHTPARDSLMHGLARLLKSGLVPAGLEFDASDGYGIERTDYAGPGKEGGGKIFVEDGTAFVGVVPLRMLKFSTAKAVLEASRKGELVVLAYLHWAPGIQVEVEVLVVEKKPIDVPEEVPADGEKEEPGDGEEEKPAAAEEEKPTDQPADGEADVPAVPAVPKYTMELLSGGEMGYLLGIHRERLAIFEARLDGIEFYGFLPSEQDPAPAAVTKIPGKEFKRLAEIDDSRVRFRIPIRTKATTSKDVFAVELKLKVRGAPAEGFRTTKE